MKYLISLFICAMCISSLNAQPNISRDRGTPADAGTLDSSNFGTNGTVITEGQYDHCNAVALQDDGKIIAAGQGSFNGISGYLLIRYNEDGSVDSSFGNAGRVVTDLPGTYETIREVEVQPDGKIVAAGITPSNIGIVRYLADGQVDSSFGHEWNSNY